MAGTEAVETRRATDADFPAPDVSVVVTIFNEAASVDELYRRTIAALEPGPSTFELIFVDDGSTDGTFAAHGPPQPAPLTNTTPYQPPAFKGTQDVWFKAHKPQAAYPITAKASAFARCRNGSKNRFLQLFV